MAAVARVITRVFDEEVYTLEPKVVDPKFVTGVQVGAAAIAEPNPLLTTVIVSAMFWTAEFVKPRVSVVPMVPGRESLIETDTALCAPATKMASEAAATVVEVDDHICTSYEPAAGAVVTGTEKYKVAEAATDAVAVVITKVLDDDVYAELAVVDPQPDTRVTVGADAMPVLKLV
jgi:hypothetical protein